MARFAQSFSLAVMGKPIVRIRLKAQENSLPCLHFDRSASNFVQAFGLNYMPSSSSSPDTEVYCECGEVAVIRTSWSDGNSDRRFYGCPNHPLDMKVEFLRDWLLAVSRLVFESEDRVDIERYVESKNNLKQIEDEIKSLTKKLADLNESSRKLDEVVDGLKEKAKMQEAKFQELIDVPW